MKKKKYSKLPVIKEIPVPDINHPPAYYEMLPNHEFTMGLIAPKGSGKTTLMINLLDLYAGYFHTIYIFSPTVASDEKWDYVKSRKGLLSQNIDLINWVDTMTSRHKGCKLVEGAPVKSDFDGLVDEYDPDFDGMIPGECFFEDYDEDLLRAVYTRQMKLVKLLKKHGQTKHMANRMLIIFDDLVGSLLFSNSRGNIFKGFNTRHRHYSTSMMMVTQAYREIPKTIRINYTCLVLYEICNEKELEALHEEFPMNVMKKDRWLKMYAYAVKDPYSFMYYNMQPDDKRKRVMKNFEEYIFMGDDDGGGGEDGGTGDIIIGDGT